MVGNLGPAALPGGARAARPLGTGAADDLAAIQAVLLAIAAQLDQLARAFNPAGAQPFPGNFPGAFPAAFPGAAPGAFPAAAPAGYPPVAPALPRFLDAYLPARQAPAAAPAAPGFPAGPGPAPGAAPTPAAVSMGGPGRGFPETSPWLTFYGSAADAGDLDRIAATHRVINIDADPGVGNFSREQIAKLKAGGQNRVLSYLNLGAVESFRDYWRTAPTGLVPAGRNGAAQLSAYDGYPDERWMDPANPAWRALLLDHVIPRLVAQGVDGLYFDNLELLSHGARDSNGPLPPGSRQAGLDLVREIRERWPNLVLVQQNGLGPATRDGMTGGRPYAELLDGVSHEEVFTTADGNDHYKTGTDREALAAMRAWRDKGLRPGGRPLLLATQEYVNDYGNAAGARAADRAGRAEGFSVFVGDRSAGLQGVPPW